MCLDLEFRRWRQLKRGKVSHLSCVVLRKTKKQKNKNIKQIHLVYISVFVYVSFLLVSLCVYFFLPQVLSFIITFFFFSISRKRAKKKKEEKLKRNKHFFFFLSYFEAGNFFSSILLVLVCVCVYTFT